MTTEIRHSIKALKLLQNAKSADTANLANSLVAEAQVHATLALVEQQRIGNLIAYVTQAQDLPDGEILHEQELEFLAGITAQVRAGLGL